MCQSYVGTGHGHRGNTFPCGCGCGCTCGCWMSDSILRRFRSRREEKEMLEEYRDELKRELEGVEERIKE